jgi:hypothetical protein
VSFVQYVPKYFPFLFRQAQQALAIMKIMEIDNLLSQSFKGNWKIN